MRPRKVILLVDADEVRTSVRAMQLDMWGYRVIRAESAEAAMELLTDTQTGAVAGMIVGLPGVDGHNLVRRAIEIVHALHVLNVSDCEDSPATFKDKVRVLSASKRGPKGTPQAYAEMLEKQGQRRAREREERMAA